jgi:hypothetical protein
MCEWGQIWEGEMTRATSVTIAAISVNLLLLPHPLGVSLSSAQGEGGDICFQIG